MAEYHLTSGPDHSMSTEILSVDGSNAAKSHLQPVNTNEQKVKLKS